MFELKKLSPDAVEAAHKRALHYRLLNQPQLAESICRDVLAISPDDEESLVTLVLCLCDQFGMEGGGAVTEPMELVGRLSDGYKRHYYRGLICERRASAQLVRGGPASGEVAWEWYRRAMDHYEQAEALRPAGNDDAILRWNTCARIVNGRADVRPAHEDQTVSLLE
jgi:hypothetical protein